VPRVPTAGSVNCPLFTNAPAQGRASPPPAFSAQRISAITRRFVRSVLRLATCEAAEDGELPLDQCEVRHNDTEHFAHALPTCPACAKIKNSVADFCFCKNNALQATKFRVKMEA